MACSVRRSFPWLGQGRGADERGQPGGGRRASWVGSRGHRINHRVLAFPGQSLGRNACVEERLPVRISRTLRVFRWKKRCPRRSQVAVVGESWAREDTVTLRSVAATGIARCY